MSEPPRRKVKPPSSLVTTPAPEGPGLVTLEVQPPVAPEPEPQAPTPEPEPEPEPEPLVEPVPEADVEPVEASVVESPVRKVKPPKAKIPVAGPVVRAPAADEATTPWYGEEVEPEAAPPEPAGSPLVALGAPVEKPENPHVSATPVAPPPRKALKASEAPIGRSPRREPESGGPPKALLAMLAVATLALVAGAFWWLARPQATAETRPAPPAPAASRKHPLPVKKKVKKPAPAITP